MKSCFFAGYESFSYNDDPNVMDYIGNLLPILVENGVSDFYSGGTLGWDKECEFAVYAMKKIMNYSQVKLHYVFPCPPEIYSQNWSEEDKD